MNRGIRNIILFMFTGALLGSCGMGNRGELTGVPGRTPWFHPQPYGTVYIPTGSFHMGLSDQDVFNTLSSRPRQVTVQAFFMDDTEITNNEYRQFVYWVRDSMARSILGYITDDPVTGEERIDWRRRMNFDDPRNQDMLEDMFFQGNNRLTRARELDTRNLKYKYSWVDLHEAAKPEYLKNPVPRNQFLREEEVAIYPDTLVFIRDFTYSFNEPMAQVYFWHPSFDDYPVVGVTWQQANAFCHWRSEYLNSYLEQVGEPIQTPFRLPTEAEWEYAARGGREHSQYPWGGPYVRNSKGCFLANFKPLRGNYMEDGGLYPVRATSYFPNDYGLYCMAGNVSEWTITAYDPSLYMIIDDLNPHHHYDAQEGDPETRKRKVIRGGSWKDVGFYIQTGSRTFEYQDSAKSYVGFRTVMTYMGRSQRDR